MIDPSRDPVLVDCAAAHLLSGLSGAAVYMMTRDHRQWFIRKAAATPAGNPRLRRQAEKQARRQQAGLGEIRVPRILEEGEIDGRYYFDMEAIRGVDGTTYLRSVDYRGAAIFVDRLCDYLTTAARSASIAPSTANDLFGSLYDRICEIQATTGQLRDEDAAAILLGLSRLRSIGLSPTLCHGDLTLENLIIDSQGEIWAFDLLSTPFEHYWHDMAKLHQDLDGGWYLRKQPPIARCITEFLTRRLLETVDRLDSRYAAVHALLTACTFVRILPYAADDTTLAFVQQRVTHYARLIR